MKKIETGAEVKRLLPAYPLFVKDPFFSVWSPSDELNGGDTIFWTGMRRRTFGVVNADGKSYAFMGLVPGAEKLEQKKVTLTAVVKEWCESLDPKSFEQLFSDGTERFLQHLKSATNDEDLFITRLAKLATGLRIEDWDGKTEKTFFAALEKYMQTARNFHDTAVAETINETSSYQVAFADEDGKKTVRRFDKVNVSTRGKLLFNQITASLDAMGHSISEQEKRQILMEVLKKLC